MTDFTTKVRKKIPEATDRGVRIKMIINQYLSAVEEFRTLLEPIKGAEIIESPNTSISIQGLSDREVVIAFPGIESYTAV